MNNKYTILLVDDQKTNLMILEAIIESNFSHNILKAQDSNSALDIIYAQKVDFIISDIEMPKMNGYEFARELKKSDDTKNIPIIFASGLEQNESQIEVYESGAIGFVAKPINHTLFVLQLKSYFNMLDSCYEKKGKNF